MRTRNTVLVDFDVWKALQSRRPVEEFTENDVLRELLGLPPAPFAHPQTQVSNNEKPEPGEYSDCVAIKRYARLCFPKSVIEPLPDDARFCIITRNEGAFAMTKREFYQTFGNVATSKSYRFGGNYSYTKVPGKALQFRVAE